MNHGPSPQPTQKERFNSMHREFSIFKSSSISLRPQRPKGTQGRGLPHLKLPVFSERKVTSLYFLGKEDIHVFS